MARKKTLPQPSQIEKMKQTELAKPLKQGVNTFIGPSPGGYFQISRDDFKGDWGHEPRTGIGMASSTAVVESKIQFVTMVMKERFDVRVHSQSQTEGDYVTFIADGIDKTWAVSNTYLASVDTNVLLENFRVQFTTVPLVNKPVIPKDPAQDWADKWAENHAN